MKRLPAGQESGRQSPVCTILQYYNKVGRSIERVADLDLHLFFSRLQSCVEIHRSGQVLAQIPGDDRLLGSAVDGVGIDLQDLHGFKFGSHAVRAVVGAAHVELGILCASLQIRNRLTDAGEEGVGEVGIGAEALHDLDAQILVRAVLVDHGELGAVLRTGGHLFGPQRAGIYLKLKAMKIIIKALRIKLKKKNQKQ